MYLYVSRITRLISCVSIALCLTNALNAQNKSTETKYSVVGRVLDSSEQTPIEFVNIILYNLQDSVPVAFTTTDETGRFLLPVKKSGEYRMTQSYLGYNTAELFIELTDNRPAVRMEDILLSQTQEALSEVVVVGQRRQVVYKLDKQVIEAAGFLSAAGGTAVDILMQTPSIRVDANGEVTFRGSSGFKVYIDGKPSSQNGAAALEQIPAGQIENIEVLTTPSARNSADGAVGIININTKKADIEGWSGIVNVMGSSVLSRNLDFLFALRKKDFRWQISGETSKRYVKSDYDQLKTISTPGQLTTDHSTGDRERHTGLYYLRSGFDWYKKNTTWSAAVQGGYRDRWRGGELYYEDEYKPTDGGETTYAYFNGKDFVHLYEYQLRGDLGVEHHFSGRKGHTITAWGYMWYEGDAMENFQTDLWDMQGKQVNGHRAWEYEYRIQGQVNADYVYPLPNGTGKFEAGYEVLTYKENGDYKIDMFDPEKESFERRDDLYNKYNFRRDTHGLYAMFSDTYSKVSYQLGLRSEYTFRKMDNNLEWARHRRNRFDFFPSVHLSYALNEKSQLRLGYARRITQPELFYVEPYIVYVDYNTAQTGNPFIKPEYTNSIEAGYTRNFDNNTFTATVFHRARKDKIERLRVPYQSTVTLDSMTNVGNDYSTGLDLTTNLQLKRFWNLDANTSIYHYRIKNQFKVEGDSETSWNWQLAVNNNLDIARNTRLRLEVYYVGPMVSTQGRVDGFFYMNFTVRQQLLKRRLVAGLTVRDIFSTAEYIQKRSGVGLESLSKIYPRSPLLTLSLSYTFNNFKSTGKEKVDHDMFEGTNR